jgi:hypothetical protein
MESISMDSYPFSMPSMWRVKVPGWEQSTLSLVIRVFCRHQLTLAQVRTAEIKYDLAFPKKYIKKRIFLKER